MTNRYDTYDGTTPVLDPNAKCSFCGSTNCAAYWRGEIDVNVCATCAYHVLPKLHADAVFSPYRLRDLKDFELVYWQALALAFNRYQEDQARALDKVFVAVDPDDAPECPFVEPEGTA